MRIVSLRYVVVLAVLAAALPARAVFHLWSIAEIYSNADGSVQFIEFNALAGGQQFLAGHSLVASGGPTPARQFAFPGDLPGDSSGRRFLVGTTGYAATGVAAPDYVVPNGFLSPGGGTINFGEGADVWTYPAMPTDGRLSLGRSGATGPNSPRNFAGATGSVVPAAADFNVQGTWVRAPSGSEPGWGLNFAHQGDTLFVGWFTYGADGNPTWFVMPAARRTGPNTYAGEILRTNGAPFNVEPYDASRFTTTTVGTGTLSFANADNGTFAYNVSGVSGSRPITRWVYAAPVSICTLAPSASP